MNVHFVTISTDHTRAEYLIRTSKYFDVPLTCITPEEWLGPGPTKMVEMRKFVADKNDNDIIIFADAYDCLVSNNLESILEKFKEEDCGALFSAEVNCYPDRYLHHWFDYFNHKGIVDTKNLFPNVGLYIGRVKNLKHFYNWKSDDEIFNYPEGDQDYFHDYYLSHADNEEVKLDIYSKVFQNIHQISWEELEFKYGQLLNNVFETNPAFLHFSGGSFFLEPENPEINVLPDIADRILFFHQNKNLKGPFSHTTRLQRIQARLQK